MPKEFAPPNTKIEYQTLTDEKLIEMFKSGNEFAFAQLFNRYKNRLSGILFRLIKDRRDTEDIVQEVFTKAADAIKNNKYEHQEAFLSWIVRIGTNQIIDSFRRSQKRLKPIQGQGDSEQADFMLRNVLDTNPDPEESFFIQELKELLKKAISGLSEDERTVVRLWYFEHKTYNEIQAITNTSAGTMKARLFRARKKLMDVLENYKHNL